MRAFKEALAALGRVDTQSLDGRLPNSDEVHLIRSALEAAQQEAEAWESIYALCRKKQYFYEGYVRQFDSEKPHAFRITEGDDVLFRVDCATRLEALTKAAAWCRAELAK